MTAMTDLDVRNGDLRLAASVFGSADRPAVLLLHGLSASRDTWEEAVRRLDDRFQVWTVDFRGHGHSDRAGSYLIADYASDAEAVIDLIGRPTVVAGHSLGAVTAGVLAQRPHPLVRAVFLEDPPWYLGLEAEWDKGLYKQIFPLLRRQQIELQEAGAPLSQWLEATSAAPSPKGGTAADHVVPRQLLCTASARARHDPRAWDTSIDQTLLAGFDPDAPMRVPATVLQADPDLGPALMAGHEDRLRATNPEVEIIRHDGATHLIHAGLESAGRFLDQLDAFVTANAT
jgi:pimeloyl-ACP methyl ester carboxylesterase